VYDIECEGVFMIKIHGLVLAIVTEDPANPTEGQVWYNSTDDQIKFFDHTNTVQAINDIYQGLTPPSVSVELIWLKTDENILFSYNSTKEKWYSIQKIPMNFNITTKTYSGNCNERYFIDRASTVTRIKSTFDRTFELQADGTSLYSFNSPFDNSALDVEVNSGVVLTCYTPTKIVQGHQQFVQDANIYVEMYWRYDS
jgi:hypothetical protein